MKVSKKDAEKKIEEFFMKINEKSPEEVKKMKKLAMRSNIKLGEKRKLFCKKCYIPIEENCKIKIRDKIKTVHCEKCGNLSRWKL